MDKLENIIDSNIQIIDLKALLVKVLKKWWIILLCMCLGCGLALLQGRNKDSGADYDAVIAQQTERVAEYQAKADSLQDYMDYSLWYEADPFNVNVMQCVMDFSNTENKEAQLNAYYEYILNDFDCGSYRNDIADKYIREQIETQLLEDSYGLKITVYGRDENDAEKLMDSIMKAFEIRFGSEQSPQIMSSDQPVLVSKPEIVQMKSSLASEQNTVNTMLQSAKDALMKAENDQKAVQINRKSLILFGMIGFIAAMLVLSLLFIRQGRVLSSEELEKQYLLKNFGSTEDPAWAETAAEQLRRQSGAYSRMIVVSDTDQIDTSALAEKLNKASAGIPVGDDTEADENTLVLLAVKKDVSKYKDINQICRQIISDHGMIVGTVFCGETVR